MSDIIAILDAWKNQAIPRGQLLRRLLEDENWNMPMNQGVDSFGPFTLALPRLIPDGKGKLRILLFADYDAEEAFEQKQQASGGFSYANPTGWEIFSVPLDGVDEVVFDLGTPHEFTIPSTEYAEVVELADAIGTEAAWKRLHTGDEEPDDLHRVAHYDGYYVAVAETGEDKIVFCELSDGTDSTFVAVFTQADALDLGWPEILAGYSNYNPRVEKVSGPQIFPTFRGYATSGIVINCAGPTKPLCFQRGVLDLLVEQIP